MNRYVCMAGTSLHLPGGYSSILDMEIPDRATTMLSFEGVLPLVVVDPSEWGGEAGEIWEY